MFEVEFAELTAAETLAAIERAQADENEAARRRLLLTAHYADLHPSPASIPGDQSCPGGERGMTYGGPGCPGVAEFAVAELGVILGVSTESAAKSIGQALALRHRLPASWERVKAGQATPWKARQIATACQELSLDAAAVVDDRVASIVDSVGPVQLRNIVKAAKWQADPEAARAAAEQRARERGVWTGRSDDHGTTAVYLKAATGDVIRFDATIDQIADALTALNGPAPHQTQRAKAIGILADPSLAHQLLEVAHYLAAHPNQSPTAEPEDQTRPPTPTCPTANTARTSAHPADQQPTAEPGDQTPPAPPAHQTLPESPAASTADAARTSVHLRDLEAAAELTPALPMPRAASVPAPQSTVPQPAAELTSSAPGDIDHLVCPTDHPTGLAAAIPLPSASAGSPRLTDDLEAGMLFLSDEPAVDAEADRDPPHPSTPDHPLDPPTAVSGMDRAARDNLAAKLSMLKAASDQAAGIRQGRTKLYVHLTDETLLAGGGVMRVELFGPVYAKLAEVVGHDRIIVQPVIDLHDQINVNAYEIPRRLREHLKLAYPVEQFPSGPGETTNSTDLDHVIPYNQAGPSGQTSTTNLRPLRRRSHRVKTLAGWTVRTLDTNATEWTTRHGFKFRVDHTGTHRIPGNDA